MENLVAPPGCYAFVYRWFLAQREAALGLIMSSESPCSSSVGLRERSCVQGHQHSDWLLRALRNSHLPLELSVTFPSASMVGALRNTDQAFGPGQERGPLTPAGRPTLLDLRPRLTNVSYLQRSQRGKTAEASAHPGPYQGAPPLRVEGYGRGQDMLVSGSHLHSDGLSQLLAIEDAFHIVLWCRGPFLHS